jgi:glycosyltransferase involved in cell wall biosynthesis
LRIIGRIPEADLEQLKADGVEFSSACNLSDGEIVEEYASADIVALVSTFEGFGMPVVEGQASGCPVVASHCCSIPSVAGDGAAFVDPLSIDSIRQGFLRVIEDESYRRQIIDRGYENVQRFRPEKIASRYLEIYEQCEKGTL